MQANGNLHTARRLGLVPPAVLVGVALLQLTLAHTVGLTPWKGGGFGMFSTVDSPDYRMVVVTVGLDDGSGLVPLEEMVEVAGVAPLNRAAAMPNDRAMRRVANSMYEARWELKAGEAAPEEDGLAPERVTVAVETLHVDPDDKRTLTRVPVDELTVQAAGNG